MKKIFFALLLALITATGFTQGKGKDYITMKPDGKVYWMRGGQTIRMMIDVPLKNGSVVNYKGNITTKDGQVIQLAKGDRVTMDGTVISKK